ncbi:MAG: BlaI/MecI/CopY family transcriptional regulator [Clostridiales bacterium]|nr:BlaI/MecI/CopY family transcriptional regulator [Clostridiales bacterium]
MIKLADAEWNIMNLLWDKGPLTTMEIIREMEDSIGWSKSTTMTLLRRMNSKGSIKFQIDNKTKKYYPCIDRSEAEVEEAKSFLNKHYNGKIGSMVSNLISQEALSKEEIDELYSILRKGK